VLALSEIAGLAATLCEDGRSEVADAVAAAWGLAGGAARFWRSSASHVFAVHEPPAYLRFVPETQPTRRRMEAVATLMHSLGIGVAQPLASRSGRLVETVATARGPMVAMLVTAARGAAVDGEDLTPARARAWGAALARLHRDAADPGLPEWFADLDADLHADLHADHDADLDAGPALAVAVARLRDELGRLPRDAGRFGVVHGDFELDNLSWDGDAPTAYDFDDAGRSWFVADIAQAVRGVGSAITAEFVAGYRTARDLSDVDLGWLPLFVAAHAAVWLRRLPGVLDVEPTATDQPPWLRSLRDKLIAYAYRQRRLVLDSRR